MNAPSNKRLPFRKGVVFKQVVVGQYDMKGNLDMIIIVSF